MTASLLLETLASRPLVRRLSDAVMGRYAAHRRAQLDRRPAAPLQSQTLLRLVRQARATRFGRDHDFGGIRTIADYQRRVPLRTYERFWSDYWHDPFPYLTDVTWPGSIPYFALTSGTTNGATKYVPLTRPMLASNQKAALTALSLFLAAHPGTPLFTGRLFFLGGSTGLRDLSADAGRPSILAGDLSGITVRTASPWLRPFAFPPEDLALEPDWDRKMDRLAARGAELPITMLSGVPSWLLVLFDRLLQITGRERIIDIWPGLRLVLHGGTKFDPYRALFAARIGDPAVRFFETYPASEGFIAAEDPRYNLLRLIPDHNILFEFVPIEELDSPRPARHTVADLQTGVQYAIVLTTCAGLWSYVLGDTVCFERRDPPLLRFTGRTRYFLSAFGEHLISEEIERAIAATASVLETPVSDFHVGPSFPLEPGKPGRHRWFVEFTESIAEEHLGRFARELDAALARSNDDYRAHRAGNLTMRPPEVLAVPRGGFAAWMRSRGRLGGQNKVPRMDNSGQITDELHRFFGF